MTIEIKDPVLIQGIGHLQKILVKGGAEGAQTTEAVVERLLWKGLSDFARLMLVGHAADLMISSLMPKEDKPKAAKKDRPARR